MSQPNEFGSYFALPRLIRRLGGGNAARSENNWIEMYLASAGIYLISYLWAVNHVATRFSVWRSAAILTLLLPGIWIFWLIVLYLNSLIVRVCWICGVATRLSRNRVQGVLVGILTTGIAACLAISGSWLRWVGLVWVAAVVLNLIAAVLLALFYGERS